jgi:hypothetical protein
LEDQRSARVIAAADLINGVPQNRGEYGHAVAYATG